ncbi:MAG: hypothetical protein RLZZ350_1705 [Verrucomicrobiota bacterium]
MDSLRFVAALWVVFSHFGFFPIADSVGRGSLVGLAARGLYGNLFAGPAAVMVFFLVSGFCIHFPHCGGRFELWPFLTRRFARITLPMVVAIGLARPLKLELHFFQQSILWSLFAELIYYSLYPVLQHFWRVVGWGWTLSFAFALALAALSAEPTALDYDAFGNSLSWLLGLPVWLLGCKLAENVHRQTPHEISRRHIWSWRLGVWALASAASALRFHSPIGYPWTLLVFSLPVFGWLRCEIDYFRTRPPWGWLEGAGQWSYSVYLTHAIAKASLLLWFPVRRGVAWDWFVLIAWVLAVAFVFYLLVEKPAHHFARWLAGKFRATPAVRA